ncbi:hypothetical protein MC885_017025, partial [Smutsia gigantea]
LNRIQTSFLLSSALLQLPQTTRLLIKTTFKEFSEMAFFSGFYVLDKSYLPFSSPDRMKCAWPLNSFLSNCWHMKNRFIVSEGLQNFALGKGDEEVISTLHYFSKVVDELNVLHTELTKQLADTMVLPIIQFREKDLTEVSTLKDLFGLASTEHDLSMARYSRLPKKKENEKVKTEVVKEVAAARRKQHLSSLQYYCALNALQYRKRMAMMEPMIGFAHGQSFSGDPDFLGSDYTGVTGRNEFLLPVPTKSATAVFVSKLYSLSPQATLPGQREHPSENAGEHLCHAGALLPLHVVSFKINFFKKGAEMFSHSMDSFLSSVADMVQSIQVELEAEAEQMRVSQQELLSSDESVYTPDLDVAAPQINRNLIQKSGYLNLRNKTGLVTTTWERLYFFTQGGNLMCQPRGAVAGGLIQDLDNCSVMAVDCEDRRYCFQITTPNGKSYAIGGNNPAGRKPKGKRRVDMRNKQHLQTDLPDRRPRGIRLKGFDFPPPIVYCSKNLKNTETENDKTVPKATVSIPEAEQLIAPGTPIQFDIVLPAMEFLDQNRGSRRINPFGETEDDTFPEAEDQQQEVDVILSRKCFFADSLLQQMFIVRFLGSMAVKTDSTTEVIYEAMRQVLAARAIHNIFRMTETHLMVTSQTLRLIDPQTQVTRANFELTSVTQFAVHRDDKRLVGFVVRMPESIGGGSLSTYIFESNSEGEKICYAINLGKEIIEVQKDPEALAQLMQSIPLTNDGKYILLNDQPDDSDGSPSENRSAESEA